MSSNGLFCQVGLLKSLRAGSFEHRVEGLQGIAFKPIVDENPGLPLRYAVRRPPTEDIETAIESLTASHADGAIQRCSLSAAE